MIASDLSSSLNAAIAAADFGASLVIWGIAVEAIDLIVKLGDHEGFCNWFGDTNRFEEMNLKRLKWFSKFFQPWTLAIEIASFSLVVIGMSIEVNGSNEAYRIANLQNSVLNKEAADARKIAGNAEKEAEEIRATNFVLQTTLLELEQKTQDRTISEAQSNLFISLTKDCPKIPVRVFVGLEDGETYNYAKKIRKLLDAAGYNAKNNEGVEELGNGSRVESAKYPTSNFGVFTFIYGTNIAIDATITFPVSINFKNGKPFEIETNSITTFAVFNWALGQMGLAPSPGEDNAVLKPGDFGILVPEKSH